MTHFWENLFLLLAVVMVMGTTRTQAASNLKWVKRCKGDVPKYAVAGGEDYPGEVLYVARVWLQRQARGFVPGKMDKSAQMAHASWGGVEHNSECYRILTNPGWSSHLEWKKSSGYKIPQNAVFGGYDRGKPTYVARFLYSDGHMIPGKASYHYGEAHVGYGGKEYVEKEWWVLVEHVRNGHGKRGMSSRFEYPDLPDVKPMKRAKIIELDDWNE